MRDATTKTDSLQSPSSGERTTRTQKERKSGATRTATEFKESPTGCPFPRHRRRRHEVSNLARYVVLVARLWRRPSRERVRGGAVVAEVRRVNKFGAVATFVDGIRFDSKAEAGRWHTLRMLAMAGEILSLERQVVFPLLVNGVTIGRYIADFVYTETNSGQRIIEDVKGHQTELFKRSAKHMAAQGNPITIWPPVPVKTRKRRVKV